MECLDEEYGDIRDQIVGIICYDLKAYEDAARLADDILAIPLIARALSIAKDYDAAKDLGPSV